MLDPDLAAYADRHADAIARDGYTVLEQVIEPDLVDALAADLVRLEEIFRVEPARNSFEGDHTIRIYNLLAFGALYEEVPVHERVLPVVERVLDPGCLVSSLSSISILPGETAQPIHADDQLIPLPKPHVATVCNTMWALTDFTAANGATRLVPGSHTADRSPDYGAPYDSVAAEMPKGSVLVWHGSLWHGGGANTTRRAPRRHRDELLRRLDPPAGEPAARHPARGRRPLLAPAAAAVRLRHLQRSDGPHQQARPGRDARRRARRADQDPKDTI